jgi:hypothetical protein
MLDELNLDEIERNQRKPAGQANQYPNGAGTMLHNDGANAGVGRQLPRALN